MSMDIGENQNGGDKIRKFYICMTSILGGIMLLLVIGVCCYRYCFRWEIFYFKSIEIWKSERFRDMGSNDEEKRIVTREMNGGSHHKISSSRRKSNQGKLMDLK